MNSDKARTAVKTFRLPAEVLQSLKKEAEEEDMTLNALCSTVLARHVDWGSKAQKLGFVAVTRTLLRSVLEAADNDKLIAIARGKMPGAWRDLAMFWFGDASLDSMLRVFELICRFGWGADMSLKKEGKEYVMSLRHSFGPRYSLLMENSMDELLRSIYHIQPQIEAGESLITLRFSAP